MDMGEENSRATLETARHLARIISQKRATRPPVPLGESAAANVPSFSPPGPQSKHYIIPEPRFLEDLLRIREELQPGKTFRAGSVLQSAIDWLRLSGMFAPSPPKRLRALGRRICIVGVHGWFPTKILQAVVGVPKGTSAHLCAMMSESIRETLARQPLSYFEASPRIDCIALEGSGCIDERTARHYGQLGAVVEGADETGLDVIRGADSVVFVAHSQGAPVTALLAARLLEEGVLRPDRQNVAISTLAGVFHGPFPHLRENLVVRYVEADAARELFELNDHTGELSLRVQRALVSLLEADVAVACIASWMDQVVPFYSAILLGVEHPNIWRSVYVDAHNYQSDFLSHFVGFALKLLNAQVGDARELLGHLSDSLAGSLYQSNAHSTLYDDRNVYQVVLAWMTGLDRAPAAKSVPKATLHPAEMSPRRAGGRNPYRVPWTMRGIIENATLARHRVFADDLDLLRDLLRQWRPDRRQWRELKLQIEPLSKL